MTVVKHAQTYPITLFVTGNEVPDACQDYCDDIGLCVTITETVYIYKGGSERGYIIGLINYPRFPKRPSELRLEAVQLATYLMQHCNPNGSYTMQTPEETVFVSNRPGDKE